MVVMTRSKLRAAAGSINRFYYNTNQEINNMLRYYNLILFAGELSAHVCNLQTVESSPAQTLWEDARNSLPLSQMHT